MKIPIFFSFFSKWIQVQSSIPTLSRFIPSNISLMNKQLLSLLLFPNKHVIRSICFAVQLAASCSWLVPLPWKREPKHTWKSYHDDSSDSARQIVSLSVWNSFVFEYLCHEQLLFVGDERWWRRRAGSIAASHRCHLARLPVTRIRRSSNPIRIASFSTVCTVWNELNLISGNQQIV